MHKGGRTISLVAMQALLFLFASFFFAAVAHAEDEEFEEEMLLGTTSDLPSWLQTPDGYVYRPAGKPDPFRSFVRPAPPEPKDQGFEPDVPRRPLTPLEQVETTQLRTVGILWKADEPDTAIAMVEMPDGKAYVLRPGVLVGRNGGVVRQITANEIIIEETGRDYTGQPVTRPVVLRLHPAHGDES